MGCGKLDVGTSTAISTKCVEQCTLHFMGEVLTTKYSFPFHTIEVSTTQMWMNLILPLWLTVHHEPTKQF